MQAIDFIIKNPTEAAKLWSEQIGLPRAVLDYSMANGISVFNRDVVPDKSTLDAYAKFLKQAGVLGPDDNPKVDTRFAEAAIASK